MIWDLHATIHKGLNIMYVAGIDIGSAATKTVVLNENHMVASYMMKPVPRAVQPQMRR